VMKFRVLKEESANSMMSGIQSFHGSFMIPVTMLIMQKGRPRYCWQNRICYCKKSLNVKVLFFLIKVWNMNNVSISFQQKANSSTKHVL
jgi:hypothetical protein